METLKYVFWSLISQKFTNISKVKLFMLNPTRTKVKVQFYSYIYYIYLCVYIYIFIYKRHHCH